MNCATMGTGGRGLIGLVALTVFGVGPIRAQFPTEPPPPAELKPLAFPPFQEAALDNGLTIILVENHRLPIVSIRLAVRAGSRDDPADRAGLADMVSDLLTKGTEGRSADQIAAEIEGVGASLSAGAGTDFLFLSTTVLTEHTQLAFDLMSDVVLNATFPEDEFSLAQTRMLSGLRVQQADPSAIADRYFFQELYGEHPYARQASAASVEAMTRADVAEWAAAYLRPAGTLLVLAGDITLESAMAAAERAFGAWSGSRPDGEYAAPPAARASDILLVHRPGSQQANILVGSQALPAGHAAYYAAVVGNKLVGLGADSRLYQVLREQYGWTYDAASRLARRADIGYWRANTQVRTEVADSALAELLRQITLARTAAIDADELARAKGFMVGIFPLQIETPQAIASQVANVRLLGLGEEYLRSYRERLDAVSGGEVNRAFRTIIDPDSAVIIVVGDGPALYPTLTRVASVRMIDVEGDPLTLEDLAPRAVALALDLDQVVARRDSFQMLAQGNAIGYQVTDLSFGEDGTVYYSEHVAITVMGMTQNSQVAMQLEPLTMVSVDQTVSMQGMKAVTDLDYADGRVSGQAQTPEPTGTVKTIDVDTDVIDGIIDDNAIQALLPALPLADGEEVTINVFRGGQGTAGQLTFTPDGVQEVTVPAGTFQALRVQVTGGEAPLTFYLSTETPRRIVKLEIVGQPIAFELVQ
jgi:zinc protease